MIGLSLICRLFSTNWGEPLKKKKKVDPSVIRAKEERRKKKIMKEIRRLQRLEKPLKPIADLETPSCILEEPKKYKRTIEISDELAEERLLLLKKWAAYKSHEASSDIRLLNRLMKAQEEALNELRLESEELYQAAVRIDTNLIPFKYMGPTETPPIPGYPQPDGAYIDVSKKWL